MRTLGLFLLLALASCATEKILTDKQYFDKANEAMDKKAYDLAVDDYQKLMEEYPFSDYTEEVQLKIAYAQYLNKQYAEAIASFQDFQRMHPTNPNASFAEYYLALSYMDQMGKKDRDQKAADNAHAHLQAMIDRYPESPFAVEAKKKLQETREVLADHELGVARFYLIWQNPIGAEARLRYLLNTYPDTETAAQALLTFGNHFRKRGDLVRATLAYATLVEHYPQSPRTEEAKQALAALKAKDVAVADDPLKSLMETLGRPAVPTQAASTGVGPPGGGTATQVDTPRSIR
jgi:outer membrane protein assembly factor BamD